LALACNDTASPPDRVVSVQPSSATITAGQTVQFTATLKDASGATLSDPVITWSSDATAIATVNDSGVVLGLAAGSATITATSEGRSGSATVTVTAAPMPVASVEVTPSPVEVLVGATVQLKATPKDASGTTLSDRVITWASDASTIATVNDAGVVLGVAAGSAAITGSSEGRSGSASVIVTATPMPVASVAVAPSPAAVQVGATVQLTATPKDAGGATLSDRVITWASDATAIATVNDSGVVLGVAAGSATITATSEGRSGMAIVTVTAPSPPPPPPPPPPPETVTLVGAGDIASCSSDGDEATANLLDAISGTVFTAGDNAYSDGSASDFANCYDHSWGRHKARTRPSPGNHDYHIGGAADYYAYFGGNAGPSGRGYYSYDLGSWHIISLNSNVSMSAGSEQEQWLRADLAVTPAKCVLAYWHHPRFSSGTRHGSFGGAQPIWQALYDAGADVVISGHEHNYERFAPQTADGSADQTRGIREFVVGTGGANHYDDEGSPKPNSEVFNGTTWGVLKLTLRPTSYSWEFVPVAGQSFQDSGTGDCH
jgi:uncharacterized protein YjdB